MKYHDSSIALMRNDHRIKTKARQRFAHQSKISGAKVDGQLEKLQSLFINYGTHSPAATEFYRC